jgi:7-cyano-7-deazaguanine synthase
MLLVYIMILSRVLLCSKKIYKALDMKKTALVLFSGGLDSTTLLVNLLEQGWSCHALSFDYGQRHVYELTAAKKIVDFYDVPQTIIKCNMPQVGAASSLLDHSIDIVESDQQQNSVTSYVPARNSIFLAYALSVAEQLSISDIFVGANRDDWGNYPDCRPQFYSAFTKMAAIASNNGDLAIHAPFCQMTKPEIILLAKQLNVDFSKTVTCYAASAASSGCGACAACKLRNSAFTAAGVVDTLLA